MTEIKLVRKGLPGNCSGCYYWEHKCTHENPECGYSEIYVEQQCNACTQSDEQHNVISKPKHYMLLPEKNIEVRDLMQALADRLESNGYSAMFISDYIQMQQYLLRFDEKNGKEDLEKAQWYLEKLIESKDFDA